MPLCYSIRTAAGEIGVTERTVHNAIRDGRLESIRIGRRVLIPAKALERFLDNKIAPTKREAVTK